MENLISYISINPAIRFGKPCIKGTRIAIADILQWLASGMSREDILDDYPMLQDVHIRAALSYAANRESSIKVLATYGDTAIA
jgi:uncharacterized protein (DUF433 family)